MKTLLLSLLPALIIAYTIRFLFKRATPDGTTTQRGIMIAVASFAVIFIFLYVVIGTSR